MIEIYRRQIVARAHIGVYPRVTHTAGTNLKEGTDSGRQTAALEPHSSELYFSEFQ